MIRCT